MESSNLSPLFTFNNLFSHQTFFQYLRSRISPLTQTQTPEYKFSKAKRLLLEFDPFALPSKLPEENKAALERQALPQGEKTLYRTVFHLPVAAVIFFSLTFMPFAVKTFQSKKSFYKDFI